MTNLWDENKKYDLLKIYVDWCTRSSFGKLEVNGLDKVPADVPVMFVANHSNTLMDALLVLQAVKGKCAFGARADVFKNPKAAAFLRFLRIVPLARERDGKSAVAGNLAIFDEVIDCLGHGVPFCMFPEGTHRTKHSLLPLKKGAFRIAVQAAEKYDIPVYIVPVGIEFGDYFSYRTTCTMNFGDPIPVTADSDMNELRAIAADRLSKLFFYLPDDENYDAAYAEHEKQTKRIPSSSEVIAGRFAYIPLIILLSFCWPMVLVSWILCRRLKDKAWSNTMRFASKLAILPIWTLIYAVPVFSISWILGLVSLFVPALAYGWFYDLLKFIRFTRKR